MTTPFDEELLRQGLRDGMRDVDPLPGAIERVLAAAAPRDPTDAELSPDIAADDATIGPRVANKHHRPKAIRLSAAAAVLVVTAVVLSLTMLGGHGRGTLSYHQLSAVGIPSNSGAPSFNGSTGAATQRVAEAGQGALQYTPTTPVTPTTSPTNPDVPASQPAKVVAVGTVAITVRSGRLESVITRLSALVASRSYGGYVSSSKVNANSSGATSSATIILRLPQRHFDSLVLNVQHYGKTTSVVTNSTDVTGQFVDYQARIAALEASRTQYLAILAKAGSIADILAVQAQINNIQSEIEQLKGERNVLVNEAAYSTLTVSLNGGGAVVNSSGSGLATAWNDSIGGFVKGFEWLVRALGPALFALLCIAALLVVGRFGWRATRRRML